MRANEFFAFTRAMPFRPFRLVLNSGKTYEVRHPEMIHVTQSTILYFHAPNPDVAADKWETVSLVLIQSIEHMDATAGKK